MTRALSSLLMTRLTEARNPCGPEDLWTDEAATLSPSIPTRIAAGAGYALITLVALVENLATIILPFITLPAICFFSRETLNPYWDHLYTWTISSRFALQWAFAYLIANPFVPNLMTEAKTTALAFISLRFKHPIWALALLPYRISHLDFTIVKRAAAAHGSYLHVLKLYFTEGRPALIDLNADHLARTLEKRNPNLKATSRPLCAYYISRDDYNGAVVARRDHTSHIQAIEAFSEHYDVVAKVISSTEEIFAQLRQLPRPIQAIVLCAHGSPTCMSIPHQGHPDFTTQDIQPDQFQDLAPNAAIILDGCLLAQGPDSFAGHLARANPGKTVFAPDFKPFSTPNPRFTPTLTSVSDITRPYRSFHFSILS